MVICDIMSLWMMAGKNVQELHPSTSLQMPKIELHRPGIKPGPHAWQAGILPKELSTL
jgi:hypothetical protein